MATLRETLTELFQRFVDKKIDAEQLGNGLVSVTRGLPLKEQVLALDILKSIPGIGQLFVDGNHLREETEAQASAMRVATAFGRNDFLHCEPTTDPNLTYVQQLEAYRAEMLEKLAALDKEIQMAKDGQSPSAIKRYADALRLGPTDPNTRMRREQNEPVTMNRLDESKRRKQAQQELREATTRRAVLKALDRVKI